MRVLILGSDGMVGHVVSLYFKERGHDVSDIEQSSVLFKNGFESLAIFIREGLFDAVINCTAIINQEAESGKAEAVKINSLLPHFLESITAGTLTVIVHRSTDCIYSGDRGNYTLEDWPDAKSFYARSKFLGELNNEKDITIRTSLIGPETDEKGTGLFHWFYNQRGEVKGFANAVWTGITTVEFAKETEWLLENKKHGVFQLVPACSIGKYELLLLFHKYFPGDRNVIRIDNIRVDKSLVPVCGGIAVPDYESMICEMRKWIDDHKNIYKYK